jgi:hypothetical protein
VGRSPTGSSPTGYRLELRGDEVFVDPATVDSSGN